jgi:hypothetical protein
VTDARRHDIDLEETGPVRIRNFEKILRFEDAALLMRMSVSGTAATSFAQPSAVDTSAATPCLGSRHRFDNGLGCCVRLDLAPAVDHDARPAAGEATGDGQSDAAG